MLKRRSEANKTANVTTGHIRSNRSSSCRSKRVRTSSSWQKTTSSPLRPRRSSSTPTTSRGPTKQAHQLASSEPSGSAVAFANLLSKSNPNGRWPKNSASRGFRSFRASSPLSLALLQLLAEFTSSMAPGTKQESKRAINFPSSTAIKCQTTSSSPTL